MNKKQYTAPTVSVTAIEVQQMIATSPTANTIYDDRIIIDPNDEETINGEECY